MAVLFSPWGNQQFAASGTALAVGHKIYTYAAGSSTPLATYTDSTGATPQSNPIILNSLGMPTTGQIWLTSGLSYKLVWTDASDAVIKTEDNITGVTGTSSVSQWQASGLTPTYVSATSFTLAGDQTSEFHVGRRLQSTNTAGTVYSTISASAYGALTTVTVINTSGVLDSGLSAVSYGLLTAVNPSVPGKSLAQLQTFQTSAVATGTTTIPFDDTIPQNTEGDQYMTLSITPRNALSTLVIDVDWYGASSAQNYLAMGLFQDSTASAIKAAFGSGIFQANAPGQISLHHEMTAGTTSATTFKVRVGAISAGTTTFNGFAGARSFGGTMASHISIKEILP